MPSVIDSAADTEIISRSLGRRKPPMARLALSQASKKAPSAVAPGLLLGGDGRQVTKCFGRRAGARAADRESGSQSLWGGSFDPGHLIQESSASNACIHQMNVGREGEAWIGVA